MALQDPMMFLVGGLGSRGGVELPSGIGLSDLETDFISMIKYKKS